MMTPGAMTANRRATPVARTGPADGQDPGLPYEPQWPDASRAADDERAADCRGRRIGILIVTYNALSTILPVLKRIPPAVWRNVEEIVIFDDDSQDATYELAVGLKTLRHLPKLHVLKHPRNLGYGGNQKAGYRYFIEKGFDLVVLLHGDGQYAPEILARMYAPIISGEADAVFGSRMTGTYGGPLKGGMPLYKFVGNRILTWYENRALGMRLTEFHSGYRAYNLHALAAIDFAHMTNDFHFDTEIIIKLHHQGFRIHEVPIPTYYGSEICRVDGLKYARDVVRAVRRYRRTVRSFERAPEFGEYFLKYSLKRLRYSSHEMARRLVGANHDVLDVGCGDGWFAETLVESGNRVVGIDALEAPERTAAFERYIQADLNDGLDRAAPALAGLTFDHVLLHDVLEHLVVPERLLADCPRWLKPNGRLIVSVPNIANIVIRIRLLVGRFEYEERGILDRTHLRFFTRRTARRLLTDHGWDIERELATVIPLERVVNLSPDNLVMRALNAILAGVTRLAPGLFGYQIMFVARRGNPGRSQASAPRD
jgi:glycosyltransferase involved in cell wall biosynthesis